PTKADQATELELQTKPEPTPKPARSRLWIGVGLISLVCITLLAIGGYRLLSAGPILPNSTETLSPETPNTSISPLPSDLPSLPEATKMVKVDTGTYEVGKDPADNYHVSPQSIALNEFWIDQYQTTNTQYEQYLTATGAPTPIVWPGEQNHPVRGVTWDQALAYCSWVNKRLPSEAEWEAAGRGPGPDPQLYPWGDDPTDGGNALQLPNQNTYEVGSQAFNVSPLQVYDMVGNVWEWVGETYGNLSPGINILRGGRFGNAVDLAYRLPIAPDDTNTVGYAGFRCVADQVR
nr:formylglycine-generating enzyme family protein [Chloroflexota bacterium]